MLWTSLSMFNDIHIRRISPNSHLLLFVFRCNLPLTISSYPPTCLLPSPGTAVTAGMVPWESGSMSTASSAFGKRTFTQHTNLCEHHLSTLKHIRTKLLEIASLVADVRQPDIIPIQMYSGECRPSVVRKQLRRSGTVANVCIYLHWLFRATNSRKVVTAPKPQALRSSVSAANIRSATIVPEKIVNLLFGYPGLKKVFDHDLNPEILWHLRLMRIGRGSSHSTRASKSPCAFHDSFHSFSFYLFILEYRSLGSHTLLHVIFKSVVGFC